MEVQTFTIRNRLGLHARAAALLVKTANRFISEITLEKDGLEVNGKSIMGILMLAASKGSRITLKVEGKHAEQMLRLMEALEDNDDVQNVYANFDISEKDMEALG